MVSDVTDSLQDEVNLLRRVLEEVEWVDGILGHYSQNEYGLVCAWCGGLYPGQSYFDRQKKGRTLGHKTDCIRQKALSETKYYAQ